MLCEKGSGSSSSSIVVVNIIFDRFAASTQVGFHSCRPCMYKANLQNTETTIDLIVSLVHIKLMSA